MPHNSCITTEFRNISTDKISEVCKRVEKIITENDHVIEIDLDDKALIYIITTLVKEKPKKDEATQFLQNIFSDSEVADTILGWYKTIVPKLTSILHRDLLISGGQLHFKDLDWRLQATLASRSLLDRCDPKVIMKITLEDKLKEKESSLHFETDVKTLENIVNTLEEAVNESNSPVVRKLTKKYLV